jgi:hypothetical protein
MATSEIEKLERRYAENPQGLTFAPLAEVHRKNGDVARALELLTAGLELHPNYIPASIVLGRCHQDLGDLPAAEAAFAHVLRLDDENVIALKSLADINERLERFDDAESWLRRLVSVDRSNEEAREQLRRVEAARNGDRGAEAAEHPRRPPAEVVALDLPSVDIAALDLTDTLSDPVPAAEVTPAPLAAAEAPPAMKSPAPPVIEERTPEQRSATDAPETAEEEEEPAGPIQGLISSEFQPPVESFSNPREALGIDVEMSEDVVLEGSAGSEFRVPDASEELMFPAAYDPAPAASPPPARPEPQPEAPEPVHEPAARVQEEPPPAGRATKGPSVAVFFRAMLAERPPAEVSGHLAVPAPPSDSGAPTRPAQDGLSLSSVFGEEGSPVPPAVPAPEQKADAGVSFDDFFGRKPEGATTKEARADPGKDDLDQFQSWLQNLKR